MITADQIKTIAVCGAGTMGAGIAQVAAASGFRTILFDVQAAMLEKAQQQISLQLENGVKKGKMSAAEKDAILERITFTAQVEDCRAELVIEAIVEKLEIKTTLFNQLAAINTPTTILASNTSSLPVSGIAAGIDHPERVAGMHFFNPAPVMKLVEIVRGKDTAADVAEVLYTLSQRLGKTPVMVQDTPGFIVNRVARHYYLEAMQIAAEGAATYKSIDRLLESAGFRMGPFALMDLIGNDVNLAVTRSLYEAYNGAPRFAPSPLQIAKVEEGALGKKSGKGFYNYL
ncbi:3-hydroxyacyl-CoA dehydrogenase NAD-binding domain-containing protein [Chitinophaga sp. CF418]|uniref:3-hydroxyacyl-CoA dehydrogenase NAD-binding domain-containing protein n=1 Tax=Chitinophaga sp. CF418 TaxID=1855287 RepID=UPI0009229D52|nr:3-hydroxyacyl-CoA dehydrogenase NAD-binding domain-containing protein [Chitinophaga sp. CF418]SHM48894.1 3-hydroxybutyryl-CoA dehydrogenase [Chitinophaga sp. CF418]